MKRLDTWLTVAFCLSLVLTGFAIGRDYGRGERLRHVPPQAPIDTLAMDCLAPALHTRCPRLKGKR